MLNISFNELCGKTNKNIRNKKQQEYKDVAFGFCFFPFCLTQSESVNNTNVHVSAFSNLNFF